MTIKVTFRQFTKVRDVLEFYEDDAQIARAISRNIEKLDAKDADDKQIIIPTPDTDEWYLELDWQDWLDIVDKWGEWRNRGIPKQRGTP